jgi:hypothetical protein
MATLLQKEVHSIRKKWKCQPSEFMQVIVEDSAPQKLPRIKAK